MNFYDYILIAFLRQGINTILELKALREQVPIGGSFVIGFRYQNGGKDGMEITVFETFS